MTPVLLDPLTPNTGTPDTGETNIARDYLAAIASAGVSSMISNVETRLQLLRYGDRVLPVTVDDGQIGGSYVCRPHSAYVLYARQELDMVNIGAARLPAAALIALFDRVLRGAQINRVVHLDNWMLSTNLHGDWHGEGLPQTRRLLTERFPHHLLAIRSLDDWSSPHLLKAAQDDGWTLIPSRQVWVVDDLQRDWLPRSDYGNDRRALRRSGLAVETLTEVSAADARRIAELYYLLYVGRYSALNPVFTPEYIQTTHRIGMITYCVARNAAGEIRAVAGMFTRSGIMTPPVVGYDTARPRSEALYRIACFMFMETAQEAGLRLHGSAGAAHFKRSRGATGVMEYAAFYLRHLSPSRRFAINTLAESLNRFLVPLMKKHGL